MPTRGLRAVKEGVMDAAQAVKRCSKCKEEKPATTEYFCRSRRTGWQQYCRKCQRTHRRGWRAANREHVRRYERGRSAACKAIRNARAHKRYHERDKHDLQWVRRAADQHLRTTFGISLTDYERIFEEQGGVCAMCHEAETVRVHGRVRRLAVDHDHETGQRRALLCHHCNIALGVLRDDPARCEAARDYLLKWRAEATKPLDRTGSAGDSRSD